MSLSPGMHITRVHVRVYDYSGGCRGVLFFLPPAIIATKYGSIVLQAFV